MRFLCLNLTVTFEPHVWPRNSIEKVDKEWLFVDLFQLTSFGGRLRVFLWIKGESAVYGHKFAALT